MYSIEKGKELGYYQKFSSTKGCYKEMGLNTRIMDYSFDLVPQHGPGNKYVMVRRSDHGNMGYGSGHNTHMQKPGFSGMGLGSLGHVMGHEGHHGHGGYGMGAASGCTTTYEKQHRRRKGGYGCDSSDDERRY